MEAKYSIVALAALISATAAEALASQALAAPAPAGDCEFHVWPSARFMWAQFGLLSGRARSRATADGPDASARGDPIDIPSQRGLLTETEPNRLFGQADHRLIVHDEGLPGHMIRAAAGRFSSSATPCYAELIVDDVAIQRDVLHGSALRILFHYRDFADSASPRRMFATWVQTHLAHFRPRRPEQLSEAAAEIREAYRLDLVLFAAEAMQSFQRTPH